MLDGPPCPGSKPFGQGAEPGCDTWTSWRAGLEHEAIFPTVDLGRVHAGNLFQIVNRLEWAVRLPVLHDGSCDLGGDIHRQPELVGRRLVDLNQGKLDVEVPLDLPPLVGGRFRAELHHLLQRFGPLAWRLEMSEYDFGVV